MTEKFYIYNIIKELRIYILGLEFGREFPGRETGGTGWAGRTPNFRYPGDVPGEGQRSAGNPPGRQGPEITKNRSLLKYLIMITSSILARFD